ncbi:MAG: hypothetical protein SAL07_06555 [Oscillatoria sp. PMC 1051.18]|nr:hypothetical protein [Oscillatoria sp. PMC 1050.18]MEC5029556.1 hypothetical protein [Oscillatoria sp. PMC 1051.18]
MYFSYIGSSIGFGIIILLTYGILQWLHIPAGSLVDWLIGIASFWWLLVIVTVPWNVYFDAREVLAEAAVSEEKNIPVDQKKINYVKIVSRWSLVVAIALHLISAIALYWLAAVGISAVGYASSAATVLLTALRPTIRGYQYLAMRLHMIRQEVKYPREDIFELRQRFHTLEETIKRIQEQLDPEEPYSWVATIQRNWSETRKELHQLRANVEQIEAKNEVEHRNLSRENQNAIAQLTEDSQFLNHARELVRFFKEA